MFKDKEQQKNVEQKIIKKEALLKLQKIYYNELNNKNLFLQHDPYHIHTTYKYHNINYNNTNYLYDETIKNLKVRLDKTKEKLKLEYKNKTYDKFL